MWRFLFAKDVKLSFRIANLILGDALRWDYNTAFLELEDVAKEDTHVYHTKRKARKIYNNLQATMFKNPIKIERS